MDFIDTQAFTLLNTVHIKMLTNAACFVGVRDVAGRTYITFVFS